jgi:hypothetical protein
MVDQEVVAMERAGFFGFESMKEVSAYRDCLARNVLVESVITVEAAKMSYGEPSSSNEDLRLMSIQTQSRGPVLCSLPGNSPHAKDIASFVQRKTEAEANGTRFFGTFTDCWLAEGGKFHVTSVADDFSENTGNQTSQPVTQSFNSESRDNTPELTRTSPLQLNNSSVPIPRAGGSNVPSSPSGSQGPATPNLLNTLIPQAAGAWRIWQEMNNMLPVHSITPRWDAHPVHSRAPPATVDLRLLKDVYVTAFELLAFFPCHSQRWHDYIKRFRASQWGAMDMYKLAYVIRGLITQVVPDPIGKMTVAESAMFSRGLRAMEKAFPDLDMATFRPYEDLTCANWMPPVRDRSIQFAYGDHDVYLMDYYVSDLVDGLLPHLLPIGRNAGPLTAVVRYALDHVDECKGLKLSDVPAFSKRMGFFQTSVEAGLATSAEEHADIDSARAFREAMP